MVPSVIGSDHGNHLHPHHPRPGSHPLKVGDTVVVHHSWRERRALGFPAPTFAVVAAVELSEDGYIWVMKNTTRTYAWYHTLKFQGRFISFIALLPDDNAPQRTYRECVKSGATALEAIREALHDHDEAGDTVPAPVPDHVVAIRDSLIADLDAHLHLCDEVEASERKAGWDPNP